MNREGDACRRSERLVGECGVCLALLRQSQDIGLLPRSPHGHCCSLVLGSAGRFEASVIEERRKGAEDLLRFTVPIPALNNSPQLKEFFRVNPFALPTSLASACSASLPGSCTPDSFPLLDFVSCRVGR